MRVRISSSRSVWKGVVSVLAVGILGALGSASITQGQTFQGGVRGILEDVNGGILVGAEIKLENEEIGGLRSTVSNATGEYSFANLQPGQYTLSAELVGFAPFVREGLIIGISSWLVVDIALRVGGIEETITVTGAGPLIESGTASVSSVIDRTQLETLPSPGRNVFIMAVTTPNVVHTGNPVWVKQSDQTNSSLLSLGGGPLRGNNYTLDGVSMSDMRNRSVIIPIFEAVQEIKVQTNTYDAEMGRTGGGVFNTIHRSGTNRWAGSALYQFRPGKLNTFWRKLGYFQQQEFDSGVLDQRDISDAPYNLAGGSFGGPIVTDRTFFWLAAEGFSDDAVENTSIAIPTPSETAGDFSENGSRIFNPFDRDENGNRRRFPNNRIPADMLDPAGLALARLLAGLGPGGLRSTSGIQTVQAVQTTGNLNHAVNDKWQLTATYLYYTSQEPGFGHYQDLLNSDSPPAFALGASILGRDAHALAINNTFVVTTTSVLNLRYGQTYFNDSRESPVYSEQEIRNQLGVQGGFLDKIYAQDGYVGQFPLIYIAEYGDGGHTHGSSSNNDTQWLSQEVSGTYSQFIGNHTLKYGGQWRRLGLRTFHFGNGFSLRFGKRFTQGPNPTSPEVGSGNALADLLVGVPADGNATLGAQADLFLDYFGGFVQDDWRVAPNLVLNLGLRIERETGLKEDTNDFAVGWERTQPFPVQAALAPEIETSLPGFPLRGGLMYAGVDGNPTHQWNPPPVKVGPRIGFAYSLSAGTVLRGGYAVFWAPYAIPSGTGASEIGTYGYTAVTNVETSIDGITPPEASASNPFPHGILDPVGNANRRLQNIGGEVYFNDQYRDSPYIQKWSLDLQRNIGNTTVVKAGYVGSKGTSLPIGGTLNSVININQLPDSYLALGDQLNEPYANPFYGNSSFGSFALETTLPLGQLLRPYPHFRNVYARHASAGKSFYNSLRLELEKRFSARWGARLNYTFTKHMDNIYESNTLMESETDTAYNTPDECAFQKCPVLEQDYSPSILHVPHNVNLNLMYQLPGKHRLLGGWTASLSSTARSGFPLVITQNANPLSAYGFSHQRPAKTEVSGGGDPADNVSQYVTAGSVAPTQGLQLSSAPRTTTTARTPRLVNWDVALEKSTSIFEGANLTLRFEFINILNGVNWRGPSTVFGTSEFGRIDGNRGFPRTFQFMTRVTF